MSMPKLTDFSWYIHGFYNLDTFDSPGRGAYSKKTRRRLRREGRVLGPFRRVLWRLFFKKTVLLNQQRSKETMLTAVKSWYEL